MARRFIALGCAAALIAGSWPAYADPPAAALPSAASPPTASPPPTTIRSPGMLAAGVLLSVAGGAAMTLGIVRITASETCPGTCANPKGNETIGGAVLGAGAGVLAAGIVLAVLGSRRAPGGGGVSSAPVWTGAPGGMGWGWRF